MVLTNKFKYFSRAISLLVILDNNSHKSSFNSNFLANFRIIFKAFNPSKVFSWGISWLLANNNPKEKFLDFVDEHVRKISPNPAGENKSTLIFNAKHNSLISIIPLTRSADFALFPKFNPSNPADST